MEKRIVEIPLPCVHTDGGTQTRACTNQEVVEDYADALRAGALFPPVLVYHDGRSYFLADGFHRLAAHRLARRRTITCEVRFGSLRDAILAALGSNVQHGLRRTNADKRYAVGILLADPEWSSWSNEEVARRCGVSHHLVRVVRDELSSPEMKTRPRLAERGGTVYPMKVQGIGRHPSAELGAMPLREAAALLERAHSLLATVPEAQAHVQAALEALERQKAEGVA